MRLTTFPEACFAARHYFCWSDIKMRADDAQWFRKRMPMPGDAAPTFIGEVIIIVLRAVKHVSKIAMCEMLGHQMVKRSFGEFDDHYIGGECNRCGWGWEEAIY